MSYSVRGIDTIAIVLEEALTALNPGIWAQHAAPLRIQTHPLRTRQNMIFHFFSHLNEAGRSWQV